MSTPHEFPPSARILLVGPRLDQPAVRVRDVEPVLPRPSPAAAVLIALVAAGAGLAAGLLIGSTQPAPLPAPLPAVVSGPSPAPADDLGDRLPGFKGALLAVVPEESGIGTRILSWPDSAEQPAEAALAPGALALDASGRWLSSFDGTTLWLGTRASVVPVATDVTGAVWHVEDPGTLAWSQLAPDGRTFLVTALLRPGEPIVETTVAELAAGERPVFWARAGLVLEGASGLALMVDGNRAATLPGIFAGTGTGRSFVVETPSGAFLTADLDVLVSVPWGSCTTPLGDPTGRLIALRCAHLMAVFDGDREVFSLPAGADPSLAWSPDGRFLFVAIESIEKDHHDLVVWDANAPLVRRFPFPTPILSMIVAP